MSSKLIGQFIIALVIVSVFGAHFYSRTQGAANVNISIAPNGSTLQSGLVGYWTFDRKDTNWNTNKTNDVSGNGNTGTFTNMSTTTSPVAGKIGQGIRFDGSDQRVTTTNTNFPNPASDSYTVSLWAKPRAISSASNIRFLSYATNSTNGFQMTSGRIGGGCSGNGDWVFEATKSGTIYGGCGNETLASRGKWVHLVGVFNTSTNTVTFYVNTVPQTMTAFGGSLPTTFNTGFIGSAGSSSFDGLIDDVRIYNHVLSGDEVKQLYRMGR